MAFNMTGRNTRADLTPEMKKFMYVIRVTVKLTMLLKNLQNKGGIRHEDDRDVKEER